MAETLNIDPTKALMVVVDMQNEFCHPTGSLYVDGVDGMIPRLIKLVTDFRRTGGPVLYTQSWRSKDLPQFTVFGRKPILIGGTWGAEIIKELEPAKGDTVIRKHTHDCFHRTDLDRFLTTLKSDPWEYSIVVTGVASNVCVYHAVMGFHLRMFRVFIPTDCIKAGTPEEERFALSQFSNSAYRFNVKLTRSDLLKIENPAISVSENA